MTVSFASLTRGGGTPRRRLTIALLAISLALNFCVVAGAVWNRATLPAAPSATERFRKLEASLNLSAQQRLTFEAYAAAARARTAQLRHDIEPLLEAAWAELGKDHPDETIVLQRFNDASIRWRASQKETVDATLSLLSTLTPDQRAQFIAAERERRADQRRRRAEETR